MHFFRSHSIDEATANKSISCVFSCQRLADGFCGLVWIDNRRRLAFEDSLPNVEKKRPSSTLEDLGNLGEKRVISGTAVKPLTK